MSPDNTNMNAASSSMALLQLASGSWIGQSIHVAARLGIADLLEDGPKSPATLAKATGTHAGTLHRLLRALASLGIFAEDADGRFVLTPLAEGLRTNAPGSLRAYAIMLGEDWHWRAWGNLLHSAHWPARVRARLRLSPVQLLRRAPGSRTGLQRGHDKPDRPGDRCRNCRLRLARQRHNCGCRRWKGRVARGHSGEDP